jgi:hypothetical protein
MQAFRKVFLIAMALWVILAACAPAQSPEQIQGVIETSVAMTVQAQNDMGTSVAATLTAQAPLPSATATPTLVPLFLPTLTPILDPSTATAFVVQPSGGGGGGGGGGSAPKAKYSCTFSEVKPLINVFKLDNSFDVVWIITNTGTKNWTDPVEINYFSGTKFTSLQTTILPGLKSGDRTTLSFDGRAPKSPGYYEEKFKVSQGYCFPFIDIQAIKPPGLDP